MLNLILELLEFLLQIVNAKVFIPHIFLWLDLLFWEGALPSFA